MRLLIALLVAAAFAGCTTDSGTGSASIYVKDAITDDFDEVHVVFDEVRVHRSGNSTNETESGWMVVYENATGLDVDLMNATGDRAVFLGEANLSAGKYTQIRIHALEAYGIKDGERIEISLANPTLKVVKSFTIEADQETRIVIDFDLEKSLHQMGPNGWKMTPVIGKTFTEVVDDASNGADTTEEGEVVTIEGSGA